MASRFNQLNELPPGLLTLEARQLYAELEHPTLIHLEGKRKAPLFLSVLLHGNETSGWSVARKVLAEFSKVSPPRSLSIFIGNVKAAAQGMRKLAGQPDFNRIWKNALLAEEKMAGEIVSIMQEKQVFAAIDIHNNTGTNPHYACTNSLDYEFLQFATMFSRTVVFFEHPDSVLSMAFANICPAITLECGKPDDKAGIDHAAQFVIDSLHLSYLPQKPPAVHDINLLHTVAVMKIPVGIDFGFRDSGKPVSFRPDLDRLNFSPLLAGTEFADVKDGGDYFRVFNDDGADVFNYYFTAKNRKLITRREIIPSMLTLDPDIIRQDCLGYIMEEMR